MIDLRKGNAGSPLISGIEVEELSVDASSTTSSTPLTTTTITTTTTTTTTTSKRIFSFPCRPGTFGPGDELCEQCPPNMIAPRPGRTQCKPCAFGRTPNKSRTRCLRRRCSVGQRRRNCKVCPAHLIPNPTKTRCIQRRCAAGFFNKIKRGCLPCPPGTIAKYVGSVKCTPCRLHRKPNKRRTRCI